MVNAASITNRALLVLRLRVMGAREPQRRMRNESISDPGVRSHHFALPPYRIPVTASAAGGQLRSVRRTTCSSPDISRTPFWEGKAAPKRQGTGQETTALPEMALASEPASR
jgi:hypothetical protein